MHGSLEQDPNLVDWLRHLQWEPHPPQELQVLQGLSFIKYFPGLQNIPPNSDIEPDQYFDN